MRPQAERQVKVRLALEKIASLEALDATEEEIEAEYKKISETYNVPLEEVKKMILAEDLSRDIVVGSAMKLVRENAKLVAPKANDEEKPAKKTAAKKTTAKKAEGEETEKKTAAKKPAAKKTTAKKAEEK